MGPDKGSERRNRLRYIGLKPPRLIETAYLVSKSSLSRQQLVVMSHLEKENHWEVDWHPRALEGSKVFSINPAKCCTVTVEIVLSNYAI